MISIDFFWFLLISIDFSWFLLDFSDFSDFYRFLWISLISFDFSWFLKMCTWFLRVIYPSATMCYCKLYFSHHILWSCILVLIPVPRYNSFHHLRVLGCYILLVFLGILCHMLQNMCSTLSIHWNHRWSCCCRYEVKLYCIVKEKLWLKIWQHLA